MATTKRAAKPTTKPERDGSPYPTDIPYTPDDWTPAQLHAHRATTMEGALHAACCLAGGWYRRPVTIDFQVTKDNDERYMLRPSDVPVLAGWRPVYELKAVAS